MGNQKRNNLYKLFSSNLIIKPLWFIYTYAVIGVLGTEDFGTFTILIAIVTIATQLFDIGLVNRTYVLVNDDRLLATFETNSIPNLLLGFRYLISLFTIAVSLGVFVVLPNNLTEVLLCGMIVFIGLYITQQYRVLFRAFELFTEESIAVALERVLIILLTLDLFIYQYGFNSYIIRYSIAYILFWIVLAVLYHKKMGRLHMTFSFKDVQELIKQGGSMYVNNIILSIRQRLPYFILDKLADRSVVGVYSSAYRFVESYMFIPNSIVQVGYARFSRNAVDKPKLKQDLYRTHLMISGVTLMAVTFGMVLMPYLIEWILGKEFIEYLNVYRIALLIFIPNGSYYLWTSLTNVLHIQHVINKLYVFNISFLILSQIYFYQLFGIKGSIVSILFSEFIMVVEYHIAISREVKLINSRWIDTTLLILTSCAVYYLMNS